MPIYWCFTLVVSKMESAREAHSLTIVIKLGMLSSKVQTDVYSITGPPLKNKHTFINDSLGTSSIVDERTHEPILSILSLIVETVAKLRKDGHRVILVSSGAIGVGLRRMDIDDRPKHLPRIQVRRPLAP
jgi:hypothetical protein